MELPLLLYFLCTLLFVSNYAHDIENGGVILEDMVVNEWDSPLHIRDSILVSEDVTLTINKGVEMRFAPKVMLAVNGTLLVKGTPDKRVLLTKDPGLGVEPPVWPDQVRLVDDSSVAFGRLQIKYKNKWRGVCADFTNWTQADTNVTCRQLGFEWGNFSFISWAKNDSHYMLYHKPGCAGTEKTILDCPGHSNIKIGSKICTQQQTVHLRCYGLSADNPGQNNWWGLELYNSSVSLSVEGTTVINESASILQNVDIMYAGVDNHGSAVPAVRASPVAPHLINVTIQHCALDGTNFTDIKASTILHNTVISNNRGHGLVFETHLGRATVTDTKIYGNHGNGIKAKFLDGKHRIPLNQYTFCGRTGISGPQTFPHMIVGIPGTTGKCDHKFRTEVGQIITLNILEMDIENTPEAAGKLDVYDGQTEYDRKIASYDIMNGTLPQGITSTSYYMYVVFTWSKPFDCPMLYDCVKFTILVDAGRSTVPEFYMNNTEVTENSQHGVFLENVRNYVYVNSSNISQNDYGAGLTVFGGAGDVHVNSSILSHNQDNGVNITYEGGMRIFNDSFFDSNIGNGINITLNETRVDNKTRYSRQQKTEVRQSSFKLNDGYGIRVANCCMPGYIAINNSRFVENSKEAVELESCFRIIPEANVTNFTVGYNQFEGNHGHAIRISPLINAVGSIANNTFQDHPRHVIQLDNTDDFLMNREFTKMKVDYEVRGNRFMNNHGFYVTHFRLTQGSLKQEMRVFQNFYTNNLIDGAFPTLNERLRAFAVVLISSGNVNFSCNEVNNPSSRFEIATHLLDKSVELQAQRLWWGTANYSVIVHRIFDQHSRYNLPIVNYHPASRYGGDALYECTWDSLDRPIEIEFERGDTLGGRLGEEFHTKAGKKYFVDRDINVLPHGSFYVEPGTKLEFENSIGMIIQGHLESRGNANDQVHMTLKNESTFANHSQVRLVEGPNFYEGRLEVRPTEDDEWGTVCNMDWAIVDANVVCQMLGWVVHPGDWQSKENKPGAQGQPIWRSSVQCTELDMNILDCQADGIDDHSCNHTMDVYVICKPPTWAGIRLVATKSPGLLKYTKVTDAGLVDPTAIIYGPAISIDYNVYTMEHLTVRDNMASGIDILHNDVYSNAKISHSTVADNFGNGVTSRTSFFEVAFCTLENNFRSGFEYNPFSTAVDAQQMRAGIHDPHYLDSSLQTLHVDVEKYDFLATRESIEAETQTYEVEIYVDSYHQVVMDILDYNPDTSQEEVIVFDSRRSSIQPHTRRWEIEDDVVDFPIVSSSTHVTLRWIVHGIASGRLTFAIRSKPWNWPWPFGEITVLNTTTRWNDHGIVTRHYNQPSNEYLDIFHRYRWEKIRMHGVSFLENRMEALHVPSITKYHDLYMPTYEELQQPGKIAEINYAIESCLFKENAGVVVAEHNHVEFSNNVWIWEVTNNRIEKNEEGGFVIELPKVNLMFEELYNHSVDVNDTVFEDNDNFEFHIFGFYCNSSIARNRFHNNKCKKGCITISGTEKDFDMHDNEITENEGKYIVEFFMSSHTPYTRWVDARVQYNNIKRNRKPGNSGSPAPSSSPSTYAFGVLGLQNVTINRNLFSNHMDYELVGGQASSNLENYLDVTENWWGSADQEVITKLIFDFDDWNSFAIAEYYPYLLGDNFDSELSTGGKWRPEIDINEPLGGRIEGHLTLEDKGTPYIVERDLTVMPDGSLHILAGVELQFYPNVGILVLGSLTARGYEDNRIKMRPAPIDMVRGTLHYRNTTRRQTRSVSRHFQNVDRSLSGHGIGYLQAEHRRSEKADQVRLTGGDGDDEGFIEIYNATERRWTIICDDNFNDRTAEVACRTMNKESSNVIVERTHLYDHFVLGYPIMHEQVIEWFWRRTFICDGREDNLDECRYKQNYHLYRCMDQRQYVFVRCGQRNLASEYDYWGNIRFSTPQYEHGDISPGFSVMEYVDMYGGGILHEEKAATVQAVHRVAQTEHVRITNCAWNGYDYIAPKDEFLVASNHIENNNGYAVGGLVLNGDSDYNTPLSSFRPLVKSVIPYNVYGLVRMCTTEKLIYVKDRLLLYFKYRFETVDCIKIIRSREPYKPVALRFLQLNMYNDSFYKNAVEMYNGEYFDSELLIGEVSANSTETERAIKYETSHNFDTMGIRITASAAYGDYGFIAEVVTLPYSGGWRPDLGPGFRQRVYDSDMSGNQRGGFQFQNVGELNPSVILEQNRIQQGGVKILNLTGPPILSMYVQNTRLLTVSNNYIAYNYGGFYINTTTNQISNSIYANITNNVIVYNSHGSMMHIEGHHFQSVESRGNYIAHNDIEHRNTVAMFGISANFTSNIVYNNKAQTIVNATVPEKVSIAQRFWSNSIYDNEALAANKTTIFVGTAKHSFHENFLLNRWNIFELVTYNRTKYDDGTYPEIEATMNWWGSGNPSFISGRIWDRTDDDNLIRVRYTPSHESNDTILQGRCEPGWRLYEQKCYFYMGGAVPYDQAYSMCRYDRTILAWPRHKERERFLGELVASSQNNYNKYWAVWVSHDWQKSGLCTVLRDYRIEHAECDTLLPYICERDPYVQPSTYWLPIIIALCVTGGVLIIVAVLIVCACCKGRIRKEQRMERRDSIRASLRSSKASIISNKMAVHSHDVVRQKRRRPPMGKADNGFVDISGVTTEDTSTETLDKDHMRTLDSRRPNTPASMLDYSPTGSKQESSSYYDSDLGALNDYRNPRIENEIANIIARPMYDNMYRNNAYDASMDRSPGSPSIIAPIPRRYPYSPPRNDTLPSTASSSVEERPRPKETAM